MRGNMKWHETDIRGGANKRFIWVNSIFVDLKRVCYQCKTEPVDNNANGTNE